MDGEVSTYKKGGKPTIIIIKSSVAKQQREIEACEFCDSWIEINRIYIYSPRLLSKSNKKSSLETKRRKKAVER